MPGSSTGTVTATGLQCDYYGVGAPGPILLEQPNPGACWAYQQPTGQAYYRCNGVGQISCPIFVSADSVEDPAWSVNHLVNYSLIPQGTAFFPAKYTAPMLRCEAGQINKDGHWATATRPFGNLRNCQVTTAPNAFLATFSCMVAASP